MRYIFRYNNKKFIQHKKGSFHYWLQLIKILPLKEVRWWWWSSLLPLSFLASLHCFSLHDTIPKCHSHIPKLVNKFSCRQCFRYIMLRTKKNVVRFYWAFCMVCIQNISWFIFFLPDSTFRLNAFMEFGSKRAFIEP